MATVDKEHHEPGVQAVKFDGGKVRMDLLPPRAMYLIAQAFTHGSGKYDLPDDPSVWRQNWRMGTGMRDGQFDAAADRHRNAHNRGEDIDPDSGLLHLALHAANAVMRLESYLRFPGMDDRDTSQRRLARHSIGLDIDGVCARTWSFLNSRLGGDGNMRHYAWDQAHGQGWDEIAKNPVLLLDVEPTIPGEELIFEPAAYITARPEYMRDVTVEWLTKNNFPNPTGVIFTKEKVSAAEEMGITLFVEDEIRNFWRLTNAGIGCLLMDQPYNRKFDAGLRRIYSLNDIIDRV